MTWLRSCIFCFGFVFLLFFGIPISIRNQTVEELEFEKFMERYNKTYSNRSEYEHRFEAFKKSLDFINKSNSLRQFNSSALYGITEYSDLHQHEFVRQHLDQDLDGNFINKFTAKRKRSRIDIPAKIDWREKGVVTEVNSQHLCGACWAFSIVETIESAHAIKTGNLSKLSTQQCIDCAGFNNKGCNGGDMCTLLAWLVQNDVGLVKEEEYPLHLKTEACKMNSSSKGVRVVKYTCTNLIDHEEYILASLAFDGPVAVAINALSWQNYLGGTIQYHCNSHPMLLNHAVQIVGYDKTAEIPHYIVRNSWGEGFGDGGYLYIAIGKNLCGLASQVSKIRV